jgi:hypothetical protein
MVCWTTELVKNVVKTNDYRSFPIIQEDLLEDGWKYPDSYDENKPKFVSGSYDGNKWGGKFSRAPDIFYTILEAGKKNFVKMNELMKIKRGFTTGVNEFFFLPNKNFSLNEKKDFFELIPKNEKHNKTIYIEKEFLKSVLKTPRECKSIFVNSNELKNKVFICSKTKNELKGQKALEYIEWGEKQKTDNGILWPKVPSVKGRKLWYNLGEQDKQDVILLRFRDKRNWTPLVRNNVKIGDVVFVGKYFENVNRNFIDCYLNSTIYVLFIEIYGRKNLGDGLLTTYGPELTILPVLHLKNTNYKKVENSINNLSRRDVKPIFEECGFNPEKPIRDQEPNPLHDRAELDKIIFDELCLTEEERKEVYWSLCELVKQRLDKAKSLKKE